MIDAIERAAEAIYNLLPYDGKGQTQSAKPVWVPGGNSLKQDEARRYANAALAATPAVGGEPQAWQRRNIGVDCKPWSSWYMTNDEPTPQNTKFDGYYSYEYRPLYAAQPASPLRGSVNDLVRQIVHQMTPANQFDLAFKVAENIGYVLKDPQALSASPPPLREEHEEELFDAATKIDLGAAVRHLRNWQSYISDHERQTYADLLAAQGKLIAWLLQSRAASPSASPLRGREDLAPSPCSDLSIGELIEWLDNPQWTNGYLNSDAANHMSAAAELIERLVSSAPPEQPAAASATGRELLKITCHAGDRCSCADGNFQWYGSSCEAHFVTVVLKMLKSSTVPAKPSFGEPVWPNNDEANDLDKGDGA